MKKVCNCSKKKCKILIFFSEKPSHGKQFFGFAVKTRHIKFCNCSKKVQKVIFAKTRHIKAKFLFANTGKLEILKYLCLHFFEMSKLNFNKTFFCKIKFTFLQFEMYKMIKNKNHYDKKLWVNLKVHLILHVKKNTFLNFCFIKIKK